MNRRTRTRPVLGLTAVALLGCALGACASVVTQAAPAAVAAAPAGRPAATSPSAGSSPDPMPGTTTSPDAPPSGPLATVPALQRECPKPSGATLTHGPRIASGGRTVALSFDDGPDDATPQVLDVLAAEHVHATFFVIGRQADLHPGLVRRTAVAGHLVGNHSYDHDYPRDVPGGWTGQYLADQLARTARVVGAQTGAPTCLFRPPGGFQPAAVGPAAARQRMGVALWSVDPRDWQLQEVPAPDAATLDRRIATIVERATTDAGRHPIVLLHDGGGSREATVRALPLVIDWYRAHGYTFVRLDGRR
jgi:peptidoglycan/xylan/chitin deacetylase (PgdA/CDA1 family)